MKRILLTLCCIVLPLVAPLSALATSVNGNVWDQSGLGGGASVNFSSDGSPNMVGNFYGNIGDIAEISLDIGGGHKVPNGKFVVSDTRNQWGYAYYDEYGNLVSDRGLANSIDIRAFIIQLINWSLTFLGLFAVAVIIYAGYLYVFSGGEDGNVEKSKKMIIYAIIGIIVILASYAIVNTVIRQIMGFEEAVSNRQVNFQRVYASTEAKMPQDIVDLQVQDIGKGYYVPLEVAAQGLYFNMFGEGDGVVLGNPVDSMDLRDIEILNRDNGQVTYTVADQLEDSVYAWNFGNGVNFECDPTCPKNFQPAQFGADNPNGYGYEAFHRFGEEGVYEVSAVSATGNSYYQVDPWQPNNSSDIDKGDTGQNYHQTVAKTVLFIGGITPVVNVNGTSDGTVIVTEPLGGWDENPVAGEFYSYEGLSFDASGSTSQIGDIINYTWGCVYDGGQTLPETDDPNDAGTASEWGTGTCYAGGGAFGGVPDPNNPTPPANTTKPLIGIDRTVVDNVYFDAPGNYTITVQLETATGITDQRRIPIRVLPNRPYADIVSVEPNPNGLTAAEYQLDGSGSRNTYNNDKNLTYIWRIKPVPSGLNQKELAAACAEPTGWLKANSASPITNFTFPEPGAWAVKLEVEQPYKTLTLRSHHDCWGTGPDADLEQGPNGDIGVVVESGQTLKVDFAVLEQYETERVYDLRADVLTGQDPAELDYCWWTDESTAGYDTTDGPAMVNYQTVGGLSAANPNITPEGNTQTADVDCADTQYNGPRNTKVVFREPGVYHLYLRARTQVTPPDTEATEISNTVKRTVYVHRQGMPTAIPQLYGYPDGLADLGEPEPYTDGDDPAPFSESLEALPLALGPVEVTRDQALTFDSGGSRTPNGYALDESNTGDRAGYSLSWTVNGELIGTDDRSVTEFFNRGVYTNDNDERAYVIGSVPLGSYPVRLTLADQANANLRDVKSFAVRVVNKNPEIVAVAGENQLTLNPDDANAVEVPRNSLYRVDVRVRDRDTRHLVRDENAPPNPSQGVEDDNPGIIDSVRIELLEGNVVQHAQLITDPFGAGGSTGDTVRAFFDLSQDNGYHRYTVRVTVFDADGGSAQGTYPEILVYTPDDPAGALGPVEVDNVFNNLPPTAEIFLNDNSGNASQDFRFQSTVVDPERDVLQYRWFYGDGRTGTGPAPAHRYDAGGEYTAVLCVSDGQPYTEVVTDAGLGDFAWGDWRELWGALTANVTGELPTDDAAGPPNVETYECFAQGYARYLDGIYQDYTLFANEGAGNSGCEPFAYDYEYPAEACATLDDEIRWVQSNTVTVYVSQPPGVPPVGTANGGEGNVPPVVSITSVTPDTSVGLGDLVTVYGNAFDTNPDDVLTYKWYIDDVLVSEGSKVFSYVFNEEATYAVRFEVYDGWALDPEGHTVSATVEIGVGDLTPPNNAPTVTLSPLTGTALPGQAAEMTWYEGEPITFNAVGTDVDGDALTYDWDVDGDGVYEYVGIGPSLTHSYDEPGTYEMCVRANDGTVETEPQCTTVTVLPQTVTANADPQVQIINVSPGTYLSDVTQYEGGRIDEVFTFNARATDEDNNLQTLVWEVTGGDVNETIERPINDQTLQYVFEAEGTYTVKVTVTDTLGGEDSDEVTVVIGGDGSGMNNPPVIDITAVTPSQTVLENERVQVYAQYADPDNDRLTFLWNMGDGTTYETAFVSHFYTEPGTYTVTVTASDGIDETTSESVEIVVQSLSEANNAPEVTITSVSPSLTGTTRTVFGVSAYGLDIDGDALDFRWDMGDGTTFEGVNHVKHIYETAGTYTVTVETYDGYEWSAPDTVTLEVTTDEAVNNPPVGQIIAVQPGETGTVYDSWWLYSRVTDPDGDRLTYEWDMGDGTTYSGVAVVRHFYLTAGTYTVTLTVSDGVTDVTNTRTLTVTTPEGAENTLPQVAITSVNPGLVVGVDQMTALSATGLDMDGDSLTYAWDTGDGGVYAGRHIRHLFTEAGEYTVTVTVSDGEATAEATETVTVVDTTPAPNDPTVQVTTVLPDTQGTTQTLFGFYSRAINMDGRTLTYEWDMGDGTTYSRATVNHIYATEGEYTVKVTVDDGLATATDEVTVTVTPGNPSGETSPEANITGVSPETGTTDNLFQFYGHGFDPDGQAVTYSWDFGDGNTAEGEAVTHYYAEGGEYTVTLTVSDGVNETTATQEITVGEGSGTNGENAGPTVQIRNVSPGENGTTDTVFIFGAQGVDLDGENLTYVWDMGDGVTYTAPMVSHAYPEAGEYTVTVTASDGTAESTDSVTVQVAEGLGLANGYTPAAEGENNPPSVSIVGVAPSEQGTTDTRFVLYAHGSDLDPNDELTYVWDMGDGVTYSVDDVIHFYAAAGEYTATVTVSDGELTASDTVTITVEEGTGTPEPIAPNLLPEGTTPLDPDGVQVATNGDDLNDALGDMGEDLSDLQGDTENPVVADLLAEAQDDLDLIEQLETGDTVPPSETIDTEQVATDYDDILAGLPENYFPQSDADSWPDTTALEQEIATLGDTVAALQAQIAAAEASGDTATVTELTEQLATTQTLTEALTDVQTGAESGMITAGEVAQAVVQVESTIEEIETEIAQAEADGDAAAVTTLTEQLEAAETVQSTLITYTSVPATNGGISTDIDTSLANVNQTLSRLEQALAQAQAAGDTVAVAQLTEARDNTLTIKDELETALVQSGQQTDIALLQRTQATLQMAIDQSDDPAEQAAIEAVLTQVTQQVAQRAELREKQAEVLEGFCETYQNRLVWEKNQLVDQLKAAETTDEKVRIADEIKQLNVRINQAVGDTDTCLRLAGLSPDMKFIPYVTIWGHTGSNIFLYGTAPETDAALGFEWDMGNGIKKVGQNIVHRYTIPGYYRVEYSVTDGVRTARDIVIVEVRPRAVQ